MSFSSITQKTDELCSKFRDYVGQTAAATLSTIPIFPGLILKSAEQNGFDFKKSLKELKLKTLDQKQFLLRTTLRDCLTKSLKASPTAGLLVGSQLIIQDVVEGILKNFISLENSEKFSFKIFSGTVVGGISAPLLAAFNGQTMGRSIIDSIKSLTSKQIFAIMALESSFVVSINASEYLERKYLEEKHQEENTQKFNYSKKIFECWISFLTGAGGSLLGYSADTYLTLQQSGKQFKNYSELFKGWRVKAITLGTWMVLFKQTKNYIQNINNTNSTYKNVPIKE
jgi:hypothetical protein